MRLQCIILILLTFMANAFAAGIKPGRYHLDLMPPGLAFKTVIHRGSNISKGSEGAALAYWRALASLANGSNTDKAVSELLNYYDGENGVTRALAFCRGLSVLPNLREVSKQERPLCTVKDEAQTPCYQERDWESVRRNVNALIDEIEKDKGNGHCEGFKDKYLKLLEGKSPF